MLENATTHLNDESSKKTKSFIVAFSNPELASILLPTLFDERFGLDNFVGEGVDQAAKLCPCNNIRTDVPNFRDLAANGQWPAEESRIRAQRFLSATSFDPW